MSQAFFMKTRYFFYIIPITFLWGFYWGLNQEALHSPFSWAHESKKRVFKVLLYKNLMPVDLFESFQASNRLTIDVDTYSNTQEFLDKFNKKQYDVVSAFSYMLPHLIENKKIAYLDQTKIPSLKNISADFKNLPFDKGAKYHVPIVWYLSTFAYDKEKVKIAPTTLKELFSKQLSSQVQFNSSSADILSTLTLLDSETFEDTENISSLVSFFKDLSKLSYIKKDKNSNSNLFIQQPHSYASFSDQKNMVVIYPEEGVPLNVLSLAIPYSSKDREMAYEFIETFLHEDVAREIALYSKLSTTYIKLNQSKLKPELKASFIRTISAKKISLYTEMEKIHEFEKQTTIH